MVGREDVKKYIFETYGLHSVRLWAKTPTNEVFRHEANKKWFGLIMDIPGSKVGLESDEIIDVLNVKCDPEMIALMVSQQGFAPAYHMNKQHWISILLNGTAPDDTIYHLLDMSYDMTAGKGRKMK